MPAARTHGTSAVRSLRRTPPTPRTPIGHPLMLSSSKQERVNDPRALAVGVALIGAAIIWAADGGHLAAPGDLRRCSRCRTDGHPARPCGRFLFVASSPYCRSRHPAAYRRRPADAARRGAARDLRRRPLACRLRRLRLPIGVTGAALSASSSSSRQRSPTVRRSRQPRPSSFAAWPS